MLETGAILAARGLEMRDHIAFRHHLESLDQLRGEQPPAPPHERGMKGPVAHGDIGAAVARRGVEFVEGALRRRALLIPRDRRREPGGARSASAGSARLRTSPFLGRSEEHTSELQSLMRISYAVFCLKKKKKKHAIKN